MTKKEIVRVTTSQEDIKISYGKISKLYSLAEWFERGARKRALQLLDVREGETVLEIGFGTGFGLVEIAKSVGEIGKAYGVDITPEMVKLARERLEKEGLTERVELYEGDARKMPYAENMFDAVYMATTLELFDEPDIPRVLGEIKRVLKSTGRLGVVSIPKEGYEDSWVLRVYEYLHGRFPKYVSCRPIYVQDSIRDAGYKIMKTDETKIAKLFPMKIVVARL